MGHILKLLVAIFVCFYISACDIISGPPKKYVTLSERIADFKSLPPPPFSKKTDILWNAQAVPYIIAQDDNDAAFALGMVQAHLRLGQMEMARHIVQGRLSESLGIYFNDIDHTLRIVDFYKTAPDILRNMPPHSRDWLQNFVAGINYYKQNLPRRHYDLDMFAFDNSEPWQEQDTIAIGKLGGTDLHWVLISKILPLLEKNSPEKLLKIEKKIYQNAQTGFDASKPIITDKSVSKAENLINLLKMFNKSGSNAFAIAGKKSQTKAPILAADPHLGIFLPNFWFMVGINSPSYKAVGMMAPATPVFAFGRNKNIAWGGTNLRAIQSHFVDITNHLDDYPIREHNVTVKNRLWFDKNYLIRDSDMGVIISDSELFPELKHKTIALKWLGHTPSDEVTAMLNVSKSKDGFEFQDALKTFGLPAQNMVFVDTKGNIGNVLATSLANRPAEFPKTIWSTPKQVLSDYKKIYHTSELPSIINPKSGFVASANNIPVKGNHIPLISYYATSDERIKRLQAVLSENHRFSISDMMDLQKDTYSSSSVALRDALVFHLNQLNPKEFIDAETVIMTLRDWNGYYNADSRGALLIEGFLDGILKPLYRETGKKYILEYLNQDSRLIHHAAHLLKSLPKEQAKLVITQGLNRARQLGESHHVWGDIHRMKLGHLASNIPLIGSEYIINEYPASGNRETIMKSSSYRTPHPHHINYGSNARQISDLSGLDNNYFVLLGGQDAIFGSENFTDQVHLWRIGHYIQMPLSDKKIKASFPYKTYFLNNPKRKKL